jgi:hypothetical protein
MRLRANAGAAAAITAMTLALTGTSCTPTGRPEPAATSPPGTLASTPAPEVPSPPLDPHDDPQQQATDAYIGMQHAYLGATEAADPDHPDLARYAAGDALQRLRTGLASIRDNGLRGRGEVRFDATVQSLNPVSQPAKITIRDCMDTSASELYKVSGEPYEDQPGGLQLVIATVEIIDGTWKVTSFGVHEVGTCQR